MAMQHDPVFPDRIPVIIILLLAVTFVVLTLAGVGAIVLAVLDMSDVRRSSGLNFDLTMPDDELGRVVWFQAAFAFLTMFLIWLFSILIVAAYAQGSQSNAAATAVIFVRISIVVIVVRFLASAAIPYVLSDSIVALLATAATGLPLVLVEIGLLIAADYYFSAVRRNAPT